MYLDKVPVNTKLTLMIKTKDKNQKEQSIEFTTLTIENHNPEIKKIIEKKLGKSMNYTFVEPIKMNDKIVNFNSNKFFSYLELDINERKTTWINPTIYYFIFEDEYYEIIASKEEGKGTNRRDYFRFAIGEPANIEFNSGLNRKGVVFDISESGIGIVLDKTDLEDIKVGEQVSAAFDVHYKANGLNKISHYQMNAKIVRLQEKERVLILGGKLVINNPISEDGLKIGQLINLKQREQMKRK